MGYLRLYKKYLKIQLQSMMQYKSSLLLNTIGQFLVSFNVFLGIYFMMQRFHRIDGFSYEEVLLCFAVILLEFSLAECFARGFDTFSSVISNSEFDRILVRPRNEIFQVLANKIELTRVGRMLQAVVLFIYGISRSNVIWTKWRVLTVIFMIIGGTAVFSGLFLIYASLCFFTIEGLEFMNVLTDGAREYGRYPISIYGKRVLQFCTFVVPYSLIQYYPLCFLLDKNSKTWYPLLPLAACLFLLPCYGLWRLGVRHYKSVGS